MTTADAIFILGLLFVGVALMGVGFMFNRQAFVFGATGFWMLLVGYAFTLSVATWDIFYTLGWFSVGLVFVSALEAMFVGVKDEPPEETKDSVDRFIEKQDNYQRKKEKMERAMGLRGRRGRGEE